MSVKRWCVLACAVVVSVLLTSSGVARAGGVGGNGGSAGCGVSTCWAEINVTVTRYGSGSAAGNAEYPLADVPPPACWYGPPLYSPEDFYNDIVEDYVAHGPGGIGGTPTGWSGIITTADEQKQDNFTAKGSWYTLDFSNPVTNAGTQCGATEAAWAWVQAGNQPQEPQIDPRLLAQYALSQLPIPDLKVSLNPATTSEVNLATFVKVARIQGAAANGEIYATAHVALTNQTVTVALFPGKLSVNSAGGQEYLDCGVYGSNESTQQMDSTGVGVAPDCGVLYQQPSTGSGFTLSVTRNWTATAYQGGFVPGETGALLDGANLPTLQSNGGKVVPVREIQASNNG